VDASIRDARHCRTVLIDTDFKLSALIVLMDIDVKVLALTGLAADKWEVSLIE
jgi:hypothetical protein